MKSKVTKNGTELPIMNLKGKPYLQVAYRLVWFREEHPLGMITTEGIAINDNYAVFKATVSDSSGKVLSTGHKKETPNSFGDFVEKAETGAIGRALSAAGYGTQFDPDLDEGERIVDSPIEPVKAAQTITKQSEPEDLAKPKDSPAKDLIAAAFKLLESQGKTNVEDFKEKYLDGKNLSVLKGPALSSIVGKIKTDFPGIIV